MLSEVKPVCGDCSIRRSKKSKALDAVKDIDLDAILKPPE